MLEYWSVVVDCGVAEVVELLVIVVVVLVVVVVVGNYAVEQSLRYFCLS